LLFRYAAMRAGANATAIRARVIAVVMRAGAMATAFAAGFAALTFFGHESPPTVGHVVAGIAIGVPAAIMVLAAITLPVSSRNAARLLLLQVITTGAILGALLDQRSHPPLQAWLVLLLILGLPIAATASFIRSLPKLAADVSQG
jgi:hypothetical protein